MDWFRIILDGLAVGIIFNAIAGFAFFICPHAYFHMFPKELKKAAAPYTKKELVKLACIIYPLILFCVIWIILSAINSNISGFWNFFWTAYIEMLFINFGDFFFLDCYLRSAIKKNNPIKNTENLKSWEFKEWMKTAVLEHFLFWPLIICTIVGLISGGIGVLIG